MQHRHKHKYNKGEYSMLEQKNIQEMTRREYCSYVQRVYCNDPQWVRTRLISKWDQEHEKKKSEGADA
jgi:hypothetical protein